MGTFLGHLIPGSMFIGLATWWLVSIIRRWLDVRSSRRRYVNSASFRSSCTSKIHVEALLKLSLISMGVMGEAVTGFKDGQFVELGNGQHIAMFLFFIFNAAVDLVNFHRPKLLPPDLDYMTAILGFTMEGFLFAWHLHGRTDIDVQVHTFLLYAVFLTIALTFSEYLFRDQVIFGLGRCFATFLQGTWFCQIGFILYNPIGEPWPSTHRQLTLNTVVFAAHIAAALFYQFLIGWFLYRGAVRRYPDLITPKNVRPETNCSNPSSSEEESFLVAKHYHALAKPYHDVPRVAKPTGPQPVQDMMPLA